MVNFNSYRKQEEEFKWYVNKMKKYYYIKSNFINIISLVVKIAAGIAVPLAFIMIAFIVGVAVFYYLKKKGKKE